MSINVRLFVAIQLKKDIQDAITSAIQKASLIDAPVKWLEPGNLHLTLYFLGDVPENRVGEVGEGLVSASRAVGPFEMQLGGLGGFPNAKKPRVLFTPVTQGHENLRDLARSIAKELNGIGAKQEDREFHAHVTLGRAKGFKGTKGLVAVLEPAIPADMGKMKVEGFALIESVLTTTGPLYRVVQEFKLKSPKEGN
jgi:RNA 2',3'-cyclic 3'-phosphodiesterase